MEIDSTSKTDSKSKEQAGVFTWWWSQLKGFPRMLNDKAWNIAKNTKQIGKDDPRKIWHAAKVGLALTLVLLFYYSWPLYHSFEQSAIIACLTVMVAFEYTAGATMSKCINIAFATALGGTLGIGAKYLAELCGKEGEPIILGFLVFILGALGTFTRFYPHMQRRYDYGCMLFVATFSLVTVSGDKYLDLDKQRMSTIMVSVATVMIISLLISPVWAGEDLHNLVTTNLENLASFLEGFGSEYFDVSEAEASGEGYKDNEKGFFKAFKSVLGSKATEESLANIAWWEPAHGSFRFNHPWKQYLKIGGIARECAGHLQSLSVHLKSKSQAPIELNRRTEKACKRMITESSKALKELAFSIKIVTKLSTITTDSYNARTAIADLKEALFPFKTFFLFEEADTIDVIGAMSVVSILIDVTKCVDKISEAVEELSIKARFQEEKKKKNDSTSAKALEKPPPRPQLLIPVLEADNVNSTGASVVIQIHDVTESSGKIAVEEVNQVAAN